MLTRIHKKIEASTFSRCFEILGPSDRVKLILASILQLLLSILDLIGVAIFGILGSLAVSGVQSQAPDERVKRILELLSIDTLTFQTQVAVLSIAATGFLLSRTLFSILLSRKILFFVSRRGSVIASDLASKFFSRGLTDLKAKSSQQNIYALTTGVQGITLGVIGTGIVLIADFSLLLVLLIGLLAVDVVVALSSFVIFATIGLVLFWAMHVRTAKLAEENTKIVVEGSEIVIELLENFREYFIRNRRGVLVHKFGNNRERLAESVAELSFMPTLSKYVIEASVLLSALVISAIQFALQDASRAVSTLVVFMAAGSRIAPAALRLQQGLISIRGNLSSSSLTLDLIARTKDWKVLPEISLEIDRTHFGFTPEIKISNLSYSYPGTKNEVLSDINLELDAGEFLAVVGKSGAGKSTFVDALLGLIAETSESVYISNELPINCLTKWPGAIAYVPQVTHLLNGSIRSNICLGYKEEEFSDMEIMEALELAQLSNFLEGFSDGLDTIVGEYGVELSGGQLQRLGIARALLTKPKLIILDEATSSLDAQTEAEINHSIYSLKGQVTVVLIAHRLSTARNADKVAYLSEGKIQAIGSFEQVRELVPDLNTQATLMGL